MSPGLIARYLIGNEEAIRRAASLRSAFWTGIALTLLTAVARSYDQTPIAEQPVLWFLGPLLFSFVSGTWVFLVSVCGFALREMDLSETDRKMGFHHWPAFMGLFWLTAPIAWLYAIPVERFLDSLNAARANIALLAIVSFWRVALMGRVFQFLFGLRYWLALTWVLIPASVEVIAVGFFGGFSKAILAGMGGMRNSPEEELLLKVLGAAIGWSIPVLLISVVVAWLFPPRDFIQRFPERTPGRVPWLGLAGASVFWGLAAVMPQRELALNHAVEELAEADRYREALDLLSSHSPADFAPARPLSPRPYEYELFELMPGFLGAVRGEDAPWVRAHLVARLDQYWDHHRFAWHRVSRHTLTLAEEQDALLSGLRRWRVPPKRQLACLDGVQRLPEGSEWITLHGAELRALSQYAGEMLGKPDRSSDAKDDWLSLVQKLALLGFNANTNLDGSVTSPLRPEPNP